MVSQDKRRGIWLEDHCHLILNLFFFEMSQTSFIPNSLLSPFLPFLPSFIPYNKYQVSTLCKVYGMGHWFKMSVLNTCFISKILNYKTMVTAKTQKHKKIKISLHSKFTISVLMIFSQHYFCSNELPWCPLVCHHLS